MSSPRPSLLSFVFLLLLPCLLFALAEDPNFLFSSFSPSDITQLDVAGDGAIAGGLLQLTYDSQAQTMKTVNSSGRITYRQQLKLWDPRYGYSASFSTFFVLNMEVISRDEANHSTGGGMAFMVSSHTASESQLGNSFGEWLGLFNGSTGVEADSVHQLVAVEFDTFKDSFDPDDNHVGIDLDSPVSITNASLTANGVVLKTDKTNTSVWVDYDGRGKQINIFVKSGTNIPKPARPLLSYGIDLSSHLPQNVYLGFSGTTGIYVETHCVLAWNFWTTEGLPDSTPNVNIGLLVGLVVIALVVIALTVFLAVRCRRSRKILPQEWQTLNYGPRKLTFRELSKATSNFSAGSLLGKGGFGAVYKGTLADPNKSLVAVKRIPTNSGEGTERKFIAEVTTVGRLRHRNLVPLLGWCDDRNGELLLVYEYMPKGSLNDLLHNKPRPQEMGWARRYKVMKGLAAALLYLHEEWETVVVHRDLKPSNVMLDADYNARLGDFALARLIEGESKVAETTNIAGTPGYMAPECLETGIVTKESDLYGFGAVAMAVSSGRRPSADLRHQIWQLQKEGRLLEAADERLGDFDAAEMERLLLVSLACCHPDPAARPSIRQVVHTLSSLSVPIILWNKATFPTLRDLLNLKIENERL